MYVPNILSVICIQQAYKIYALAFIKKSIEFLVWGFFFSTAALIPNIVPSLKSYKKIVYLPFSNYQNRQKKLSGIASRKTLLQVLCSALYNNITTLSSGDWS